MIDFVAVDDKMFPLIRTLTPMSSYSDPPPPYTPPLTPKREPAGRLTSKTQPAGKSCDSSICFQNATLWCLLFDELLRVFPPKPKQGQFFAFACLSSDVFGKPKVVFQLSTTSHWTER